VTKAVAADKNRWQTVWPDALAFLVGLGIAWISGWGTGDLIWSLWLSSLVVGYAMIVWTIFNQSEASVAGIVGGLFLLAFFTVHFGMFHFVHSMFVNQFFPLGTGSRGDTPDYWVVFANYGIWLPVAFFAERSAFRRSKSQGKGLQSAEAGKLMFKPYVNVVRLHLLIFFFAFAHFMKLENYAVYAVVYAVYFFPWRLLRGSAEPLTA
jgi:hypothetical protein